MEERGERGSSCSVERSGFLPEPPYEEYSCFSCHGPASMSRVSSADCFVVRTCLIDIVLPKSIPHNESQHGGCEKRASIWGIILQ